MTKVKNDSYVRNCLVQRKEDEVSKQLFLFDTNGEILAVTLDGYAIIPMETYNRLAKKSTEELV